MKKYLVHIIWLVVAILAFVGGIFYQKSKTPTLAGRTGAYSSSTRPGAGFVGPRTSPTGGFVTGSVTAVSSSSLTLQLANGNSEVVFYSTSTAVTEPKSVSPSALVTGTDVMIGGTQNSDGSLTAQSIQVRPMGMPPASAQQ